MSDEQYTIFQGKRVLIFQQRGWGTRTGHMLAKQLQAKGCRLGAVVFKNSTLAFTAAQPDVHYDVITSYDQVVEDPQRYLGTDTFTLQEICDDLGIDSVWPFVRSQREHVKSYRDKFYYGYKQDISDEEIVAYVKAVYKNIRTTFKQFTPDAIITPNFGTPFHIFYGLYAKKLGIQMLRVTDSRVRGVCIIVYDHNDAGGRFFERFTQLRAGAKSANVQRAREYITASAQKLVLPLYAEVPFMKKTFVKRIREYAAPVAKIFRFYFKPQPNRIKNMPVTIDYQPPRYVIRDFFAFRRYSKFAQTFSYTPLEHVGPFIYFPLQFQPEETIDVLAPKFNNQLEVIRQVAMAAPGDYTVVVKEHPTMVGYRNPSYLEKITRTPNVKLVDYRIPSEQLIRRADLVVNLSGTTLSEAAFLRKPAIQFGNLATTKLLPNVFPHSDFGTLTARMKEALRQDLHTPEYDRKLLDYVCAAYDVGAEVDYIGIWRGLTTEKLEVLLRLYLDEMLHLFNQRT